MYHRYTLFNDPKTLSFDEIAIRYSDRAGLAEVPAGFSLWGGLFDVSAQEKIVKEMLYP
jgi:hypothetical protein